MIVSSRRRPTARALIMTIALVALAGAPRPAAAAPLRAGVAVEDITTAHPTVAVHDPLHVKALVVRDANTEAVIICLDLVIAPTALVADIRRRLQENLGIAASSVLVSATHNHHTEGQEASDIAERTLKAVRRARETMVPVKMGVTTGHEDRITMNRRLLLKDGAQWTIRRANPSPRDSEVVSVGPVDPEIGILRLDRVDGRPLAVLYNFAAHAYGGQRFADLLQLERFDCCNDEFHGLPLAKFYCGAPMTAPACKERQSPCCPDQQDCCRCEGPGYTASCTIFAHIAPHD